METPRFTDHIKSFDHALRKSPQRGTDGKTIRKPAIAGSEDHAYPQPISGRGIAAAAGGTEVTIEGAGHSVASERPDVVAHHLLKHFTAGQNAGSERV